MTPARCFHSQSGGTFSYHALQLPRFYYENERRLQGRTRANMSKTHVDMADIFVPFVFPSWQWFQPGHVKRCPLHAAEEGEALVFKEGEVDARGAGVVGKPFNWSS